MMYVRYALYALISLVAFVFTYLTCPIWAFIAALLKLGRLPGPFGWVHTHDDNIYGARMRFADYGESDVIPTTFKKRFTTACWWIWRNPNYGFNSDVLGLPIGKTIITYDQMFGGGYEYKRWTLFEYRGSKYFGYSAAIPYGSKRYVKIWLGWQWHPLDGSDRYMFKFSFNPFRSRES